MTIASVAFPSVKVAGERVEFKVVMEDGLIVTVSMSKSEAGNLASEIDDELRDSESRSKTNG